MLNLDELDTSNLKVTGGAHFCVIVMDDIVIKTPWKKRKDKFSKSRISEICKCHNQLAKKIEGVLPAEAHGEYMVMPRAPGIPKSKLTRDQVSEMKERIKRIRKEARRYGWRLQDLKTKDAFFDLDNDIVYVVDFSSVKRM